MAKETAEKEIGKEHIKNCKDFSIIIKLTHRGLEYAIFNYPEL